MEVQKSVSTNKEDRYLKILDIARHFSHKNSLGELLDYVSASVIDGLQVERCSLFLVDREKGEIWSKVATGETQEIRFPLGQGIAGETVATGRSQIVPDAYSDSRFNKEVDVQSGFKTRNILSVPLINTEGEPFGCIQAVNKSSEFNDDDVDFLNILGMQAGAAIESVSLHEENKKLIEAQKKAEKMATVGQAASSIIHDIKNPLTVMQGMAELIKVNAKDHPKIPKWCDSIRAQVDRCINMLMEILDFVRGKQNYQFEHVLLDSVFTDVLGLIAPGAEKAEVQVVSDLQFTGEAELDPHKLKRVLLNISGNALEVLKPGQKLTLSSLDKGDSYQIKIADEGPGIPQEIKEHLFEPFVTHGKKNGTGLGLSIVQEIVKNHRGQIQVDSAQGQGTTFTITLPKKVTI